MPMQKLRQFGALTLTALGILGAGACVPQPAATPIPLLTVTPSGPIIVTIAAVTPDRSATPPPPTGANTFTPIPSATLSPLPPTEAPTITSSGPTLAASINNAKTFDQSVPKEIGPFVRAVATAESSAAQFGGSVSYRTAEGARYQVVLWITDSAQSAIDRYSIETKTVQNKQAIPNLGDEAILGSASSTILGEVRYRNMVLIVYRPDPKGTVPKTPISDDQAIALLTALFKAIPQS